jgi:tRNA A-37 threonylcarbamoyl transferase component Bud32
MQLSTQPEFPRDPQESTRVLYTLVLNKKTLKVMRALWGMTILAGAVIFLIAITSYYDTLMSSSAYNGFILPLETLNIPRWHFVAWMISWDVIVGLVCTVLATFIFYHRSSDWLVFLMSLSVFLLGVSFAYSMSQHHPLVAASVTNLGFVVMIIAMNLFPIGTFKPSWGKWLSASAIVFFVATIPIQMTVSSPSNISNLYNIALVFAMGFVGLSLLSTFLRFRDHCTPTQKQQLKLVLYFSVVGFICSSVAIGLMNLPEILSFLTGTSLTNDTTLRLFALVSARLFDAIGLLLVPIGIFMSIFKTRLWEIDLVINRSLVGGLVSVSLLLICLVVALVINSVLGVENSSVTALIAIVIGAFIFNPIRRQVRHFVDIRIYRLRFDQNRLKKAQRFPSAFIPVAGRLTSLQISNYYVDNMIGKGGMGEVYLAHKDRYSFAMKVLNEIDARQPISRERFLRESEILNRLKHPNITKTFEVGEFNNTHYIVMELLDGVELSTHIKQKGAFTVDDMLAIVKDISSALDFAHKNGVIHRDVKPSNIMLCLNRDNETFRPVLIDFGIAKDTTRTSSITNTDTIGTITYMAPEQIQGHKVIDYRVDLYSLGIVTYEMLAATTPFIGATGNLVFAHLQQPAPNICERKPEIPEYIAKAIQKAMEKNPSDRFESAMAFYKALSGK